MLESLDTLVLAAAAPLAGTTMSEVMVGAVAMVVSAVFGSVYSAWAGRKSQLILLEKQIELNKQMHSQLMEEHQQFQQQMEGERRQYEQSQEFHRESRQRAQNAANKG